MMRVDGLRRLVLATAAALLLAAAANTAVRAQGPEPARGIRFAQISPTEMQEWLGYLASDDLQGRQTFTEGYGLAASYVARHLKEWGGFSIANDERALRRDNTGPRTGFGSKAEMIR